MANEEEIKKELGRHLKKLRNERGYTLTELGEMIGYSNPYLSQIENGGKGIPSPRLLRSIAEALEVDPIKLMRKAGHITEGETRFVGTDGKLTQLGREAAHIAARLNKPKTEQQDVLINPELFPNPNVITKKIKVPSQYKAGGETRNFINSDVLDLYYLIEMSKNNSELLNLKFKGKAIPDEDKDKILAIIDTLLD